MLISEFQIEGFRFIEIKSYVRLLYGMTTASGRHVRRFNIQQWCPLAGRWYRVLMPGVWYQNFESEDETPINDDICIIKPALLKVLENPPKAVIVCREKHGVQYFSANNTEEIGLAALHIVKERHEQGYYSLGVEPIKPDRKPEDFLDSPKFATVAKKEWEIYERSLRQYKEEKHFYEVLECTLSENHYGSAVYLLEDHNDSEYEGFVIEPLIVALIEP